HPQLPTLQSCTCDTHLHHLHSFPTRRSSDLPGNTDPGSADWGKTISGMLGKYGVDSTTVDQIRQRAATMDTALRRQANDVGAQGDRKSTRLNSSHVAISYAVFCLKKKNAIVE